MTIFAKAKWSCLRGRNVIGFIPGADPKFGESLPQTLVLAAPLDNLAEVPTLSPAAREAANLAALLSMAAKLHRELPERDVLVCFFDGQCSTTRGPARSTA